MTKFFFHLKITFLFMSSSRIYPNNLTHIKMNSELIRLMYCVQVKKKEKGRPFLSSGFHVCSGKCQSDVPFHPECSVLPIPPHTAPFPPRYKSPRSLSPFYSFCPSLKRESELHFHGESPTWVLFLEPPCLPPSPVPDSLPARPSGLLCLHLLRGDEPGSVPFRFPHGEDPQVA